MTSGVFILDCDTEIFVWVGRKSSMAARLAAMQVAQRFVKGAADRPSWVQLTQIYEHAEPYLFKSKFPDWVRASLKRRGQRLKENKRQSMMTTGHSNVN